MALLDDAGFHAVDHTGGDAEGPPAFGDGGVAGVGIEADQAEGDGGLDDGAGDGGHRRGELHVVAEFAGDHDVAGAEVLALFGGQGVIGFQVVAQAPVVVHPDAMARGGVADGGGESAVAVPVLVVGGGQAEADGELDGEGGGEPFDGQARGEDRQGRGDGQQVARRSGEKDGQPAEEEDDDPEDEEEGAGIAAAAPGGDGEQGSSGNTMNQAWMESMAAPLSRLRRAANP